MPNQTMIRHSAEVMLGDGGIKHPEAANPDEGDFPAV